jgi:hypothetical protein
MRYFLKGEKMAALDAKIIVEIEPVVKLYCGNFGCKFNLVDNTHSGYFCCKLKFIEIGEGGVCLDQEKKEGTK